MSEAYQVSATTGLNLRELPDASAEILVTLPRGQFVTRLDTRNWGDGWYRVEAELNMLVYQGYVSSKFLAAVNPIPEGRPGDLTITAENLLRIVPNGRRELCEALAPAFERELPRYAINTPLRVAHFMAQMAHECAWRYMEELGNDAYFSKYDGRKDLGNTQPGDGLRYKGRGIIQLTGRSNYRHYGGLLGLDLEGNPEQAAQPPVAVLVACEYWKSRKINDPADADDVYAVTKRINGGLNGIDDRIMKLRTAKSIWPAAVA